MYRGYIKLWRKIEDSAVIHDDKALRVFIWFLLDANHKDRHFPFNGKEIIIHRGQLIFGINTYGEKLKMNPNTLYAVVKRLIKFGLIDKISNNKFSIITVKNYTTYQDQNVIDKNKIKTKQKQNNTPKECKNEKNVNNIYTPSETESTILETWNHEGIIVHKLDTFDFKKLSKVLDKVLREYTLQDIVQAIKNYGSILKDKNSFFKYKWSLLEFLTRDGALKFYPDRYIKTNYTKGGQEIISEGIVESEETKKLKAEMGFLNGF